ncbi:uncharacterized protein LOC115880527 isoform X2 [Sitophilus oryzae]|uniref:Uncharacterized protein LOC115880527 isoform X2 n=1 Tax=Sitophilus oryzae TaxID=7048 RepID=A0A6J2XQ36_SITOR|nr:uncharacterized protein LOC115880527 isoform X2 [Sitophilus oryzae]
MNVILMVTFYTFTTLYTYVSGSFVPERILDLRYPSNYAEDHSKVICSAEEVYPKPELRLYLNGSEIENTTISIEVTNNGLYSIELAAIVDILLDGTEVVCELTIIQANYTVKKEAIYYKARTAASYGHSSQLTSSSILHICLFLLYKIFF